MEALPILCKNVHSSFLRDTLWKMLEYTFQRQDSEEQGEIKFDMTSLLSSIKDCLKTDNITEDNRNMLSGLIESYFEKLDCEHKVCGVVGIFFLDNLYP